MNQGRILRLFTREEAPFTRRYVQCNERRASKQVQTLVKGSRGTFPKAAASRNVGEESIFRFEI